MADNEAHLRRQAELQLMTKRQQVGPALRVGDPLGCLVACFECRRLMGRRACCIYDDAASRL